jgi:hypothetical protein
MRIAYVLMLAFSVGLSATVQAQLPLPAEPEPGFSRRPQCTRDFVRSVETLVKALEKLRTSGPETLGRVCSLAEMGSAWLGGELPEGVREELRRQLGIDVDLGRIIEQCRAGQNGIEHEIAARLRQLKAELTRCDDTI